MSKVKLSLCLIRHRDNLIKYHAMKINGSGSIAPCILNLGTIWEWVVSFTPADLSPGKKPTENTIVGTRTDLDGMTKRKIPVSVGSRTPAVVKFDCRTSNKFVSRTQSRRPQMLVGYATQYTYSCIIFIQEIHLISI
jgi:hypothetical protein